MASRLVSLVRIFNRTGQVTNSNPNSWAAIATWRKFFALKQEPEAQNQECEGHNDISTHKQHDDGRNNSLHIGQARSYSHSNTHTHSSDPVQSEVAIRARNEFLREQQRNVYMSTRGVGTDGRNAQQARSSLSSDRGAAVLACQRENDVLQRPNLEIPVRGVSCTLAQ